MRRLILMRHAKSDWDDPAQADHERVLNKRGRRACAAIGSWLRDKGYLPDETLCSTAARTVETWNLLADDLPDPPTARLRRELYLADPDTILEVLHGASGRCVALLGHNPGIGQLAGRLAAADPAHEQFARFPTLSTLIVEFDIDDWAALTPGTGTVTDFIVPRDLTG